MRDVILKSEMINFGISFTPKYTLYTPYRVGEGEGVDVDVGEGEVPPPPAGLMRRAPFQLVESQKWM